MLTIILLIIVFTIKVLFGEIFRGFCIALLGENLVRTSQKT
jgi:hypothetical protein